MGFVSLDTHWEDYKKFTAWLILIVSSCWNLNAHIHSQHLPKGKAAAGDNLQHEICHSHPTLWLALNRLCWVSFPLSAGIWSQEKEQAAIFSLPNAQNMHFLEARRGTQVLISRWKIFFLKQRSVAIFKPLKLPQLALDEEVLSTFYDSSISCTSGIYMEWESGRKHK